MLNLLQTVSAWSVPCLVLLIPLYAYYRGVSVYDEFVEGAAEGLTLAKNLLPFLVAMLGATAVFTQGGAMDFLGQIIKPLSSALGIPAEVIPLALLRPLSGSGSLGLTASLLQEYGADSFIGRMASIMQGSTETTFYVLSVYFGAVGIKRFRYALAVGLIGDITAFAAAFYFTRLFF